MSLTGVKTRAKLSGTLATLGPWSTLFARSGYRVYPYQLGCMIRTTSTGTSVDTHGLGQFDPAGTDYAIPCTATFYGDSTLFIPQVTAVTQVTAVSTSDDVLTISPARSLTAGDFLLNIGPDTGALAPVYDGSIVPLYTDNAGNNTNSNKYLVTSTPGAFLGWVNDDYVVVDLLITDGSGIPRIVNPFFALGPAVV